MTAAFVLLAVLAFVVAWTFRDGTRRNLRRNRADLRRVLHRDARRRQRIEAVR